MTISFRSCGAALLLATACSPACVAASFTYQTISDPSSPTTRVFGINDLGALSGDHGGGPVFTYANGVFTEYGGVSDGYSTLTFDTRINDAGNIEGTDGGFHVFTVIGGTASSYLPPNATEAFGSGINDSGTTVGNFDGPNGFEAYSRLQNGAFSVIDVPGSTFTEVLGLANDGDMVGSYGDNNGTHGFLYHNGVFTTLDTPGGNTLIWGVNDSGNVAGNGSGYGCPGGQNSCGFFYAGGALTAIAVPGALNTTVQGMNDFNQIVGSYETADGQEFGFEATPMSGAPEPGTLGLVLGVGVFGLLRVGRDWTRRQPKTRLP
jgi:hypothetical protein